MKTRHSVIPRTLCFVFYKNEVLMIKASAKKEWHGTYNALGGHIEKGESIVDSAEREILEESGLKVINTKLKGIVHAINFFDKNVMMFVTSSNAKTKKVISNDEGTLEWIKIDAIEKIKVFEDLKPILSHLLEMKQGEIFVGSSEYDGKDKLISLDIKIK